MWQITTMRRLGAECGLHHHTSSSPLILKGCFSNSHPILLSVGPLHVFSLYPTSVQQHVVLPTGVLLLNDFPGILFSLKSNLLCTFFLAKCGHCLHHMTNVHLACSWFLQLHIVCEIDAAPSVDGEKCALRLIYSNSNSNVFKLNSET